MTYEEITVECLMTDILGSTWHRYLNDECQLFWESDWRRLSHVLHGASLARAHDIEVSDDLKFLSEIAVIHAFYGWDKWSQQ